MRPHTLFIRRPQEIENWEAHVRKFRNFVKMKAKVLCWFFLFNLLVSLVLANGETKRARLEVLYTQQFELEHIVYKLTFSSLNLNRRVVDDD